MTEDITDFYCKTCKKYYASYHSLWIHNKKFHINQVNPIVSNVNHIVSNINPIISNSNINKCKFCLKYFNHRSSKSRHKKNCNNNNNNNNKLENEIIEIKKENIDIKNEKIEDFFISSKKAKLFLQNMLKELLGKSCKIHPKTLQKINNDMTSDNSINSLNNELKSNDTAKIIKSDDNKFEFDINKNFLLFHDKPIKYFFYNDQVYFKGIDVASMLEYNDTDQAIRKNVDNEDTIIIGELLKSEHPKTVFINESIIKKL
jgi:hypothetical protein